MRLTVGADDASTVFEPVVSGELVGRLARTPDEVVAAQALRYRVFYDEMSATPSDAVAEERRDFDRFDDFCDHLLVIDQSRDDLPCGVVATYRLLRSSVAAGHGGFYTSDEFDISHIVARFGETLELGRSCVAADYRTRSAMQLLWQSIAQYVFHYDIEIMFGCASMPGTEPARLALPLSYLHHFHLAPEEIRPHALAERRVETDILAAETIDRRSALGALPPLIKGYLRLGGFVGDGAVVDHAFNTTDISIVVKTDLVTRKYYRHYERKSASESAADPGDPDG